LITRLRIGNVVSVTCRAGSRAFRSLGVVPQTGLAPDTERAIDESLGELAKSLATRGELLATGLGA
jgi:hypothetical protein